MLYNDQNPVNEEAARSLSIIITDETEPGLLKDEVESVIKKSDGKALGSVTVSAEKIKDAGEEGIEIFYSLCKQLWETELFPED